jgi:hypothetical protein
MTDHMADKLGSSAKRLIQFRTKQERARTTGMVNNNKLRLDYKQYADVKAREPVQFTIGQPVWARNHQSTHRNKKLGPRWLAAIILSQCAPMAYKI